MKTLKELNSKWYWRTIKVLYSFVILCISIILLFYYYNLFGTNYPEFVKKMSTLNVLSSDEMKQKIGKLIQDNPNITDDEIKAVIQNLKDNYNYVFSDNPVIKAYSSGITNIEREKLLNQGINNISYDESIKLFGGKVNTKQDYHGPREWLKTFLVFTITIIGIITITLILRSILYYIIFGNAFPKE